MSATRTKGTMSRSELLALPTTTDLTTAGRALGISRSTAYELRRQGAFPTRVLQLGNKLRVPTAELLALLGIERPEDRAPAA